MEDSECSLCSKPPYSTMYLENLVIDCVCGNNIKSKFIPAIYLGINHSMHVCIIPFPGCTVCGRPMNIPWTVALKCHSNAERAKKFREVYHNYGQRN